MTEAQIVGILSCSELDRQVWREGQGGGCCATTKAQIVVVGLLCVLDGGGGNGSGCISPVCTNYA
jgi:hypothetical protein